MKNKFVLLVITLFYGFMVAQTTIKVMNYNLMHFPGTLVYDDFSGNFVPRTAILTAIVTSYQPDILMVCELENQAGANVILNDVLNAENSIYNAGLFIPNQSTPDTSLQQLVFYNRNKLTLQYQDNIQTAYRDINHYNFTLNTSQNIELEVFVTHLKSSTGTSNQLARLQMVHEFTNYLSTIPPDHYVIIGGDFNLYSADEPAYTELLDSTNPIVMIDPINAFGDWSNNVAFSSVHTQSPLLSNGQFQSSDGSWDGVTGGLDDRFDFMLVSENFSTSNTFYYVENSYKAYGNNGNCYNSYIANPDCSGTYSPELREWLHTMSDHLPVVMELQTPFSLQSFEWYTDFTLTFLPSNLVHDKLQIEISDAALFQPLNIYTLSGQKIKTVIPNQRQFTIEIEDWASGMYFLKWENNHKLVKFIKS